jgi:hypothetical protein
MLPGEVGPFGRDENEQDLITANPRTKWVFMHFCKVARTRPGFAPPQICLPSTFRCEAYLFVDPRFCLRPPSGAHCCSTLAFWLPFASVGLGLDFAWYLCQSTKHHHLAAGPCPAHIGIGSSLTATPSHTTQHTGPYCAVRLIPGRIRSRGTKVQITKSRHRAGRYLPI